MSYDMTTNELLLKIEKITGVIPVRIQHYQGRRLGDFWDKDYLFMNGVRSGTYFIKDDGDVMLLECSGECRFCKRYKNIGDCSISEIVQ